MNYKTYTNFEFKFNSLFEKSLSFWMEKNESNAIIMVSQDFKKFARNIQQIEHFDWCQLYNVEYYGIVVDSF